MPDAVPAIPEKGGVEEVRKACFHFADLYFHFVAVLVTEFGEPGAGELVGKVLRERAAERGQRLRSRAAELGLEPKVEEFEKVTDIPFLGWDPRLGRETCPYAAAWLPRYADHPWFPKFARMYCDINDTGVIETFTRTMSQRITKNVLAGDDSCERIYFPKDPGLNRLPGGGSRE